MSHGVDMGLRGVDLFQAANLDRGKDRLHDQPGPEARKAVQDAALFAEKRDWNGDNSEDDGVQLD